MTNAKSPSSDFPAAQPPPDYGLLPNSRPRSLWSQIGMVLLQPGRFFRTLSTLPDSRQWVWAALLILVLVGFSAVQADSHAPAPADSQPGGGVFGPVPGDPFEGEVSDGVAISGGRGGFGPVEGGPGEEPAGPGAGGGEGESSPSDDWTTALIAASNIVAVWIIAVALLAVVSLLRGVAPQWGHSVQIAVWASVPLGLMAALQLVYFFAGGTSGEPGMAGLLPDLEAYADLPDSQQALALSFASRLTLFSVWALALVYVGGRQTLRGPWLVVTLAVLALVALIVAIPVVAGTITAPEEEAAAGEPGEIIGPDMMPGEIPPGEFPPGAEFPGMDESGIEVLPGDGMPGDVPPMDESGEAAIGGAESGIEVLPGDEAPGDVPPMDESGAESGTDARPEAEPSGAASEPAPRRSVPDAIEVAPGRSQ